MDSPAQAGDKTAYEPLVRRYWRLMVSVAYHQGLDLQAAEDAAQEAFIKAWWALPRFDPAKGRLRAWLCRIALHVAIDAQRRARPVEVLDEQIPDTESNPAGQVEVPSVATGIWVRQALWVVIALSRRIFPDLASFFAALAALAAVESPLALV